MSCCAWFKKDKFFIDSDGRDTVLPTDVIEKIFKYCQPQARLNFMLSSESIFRYLWFSMRVQITIHDKLLLVKMLKEQTFGDAVEFHLQRYFGELRGDNPLKKDIIIYRICTFLVGGLKIDFETHHTLLREAIWCFPHLVQIHLENQYLSTLVTNAIKRQSEIEFIQILSCKSSLEAVQELIKDVLTRKLSEDPADLSLSISSFSVEDITDVKKSLFSIDIRVHNLTLGDLCLILKNVIIDDTLVELQCCNTNNEKLDEFLNIRRLYPCDGKAFELPMDTILK